MGFHPRFRSNARPCCKVCTGPLFLLRASGSEEAQLVLYFCAPHSRKKEEVKVTWICFQMHSWDVIESLFTRQGRDLSLCSHPVLNSAWIRSRTVLRTFSSTDLTHFRSCSAQEVRGLRAIRHSSSGMTAIYASLDRAEGRQGGACSVSAVFPPPFRQHGTSVPYHASVSRCVILRKSPLRTLR